MFTNPVVGGIQLVRNAIQSANYVAGVSGWTIRRDGTAEFASGTFRGPVIIVDSTTGAILATIGADGTASFLSIETSDISLDGESLVAILASRGKGIVGQFRTTSTLPAPGTSSSFTNTCWTQFEYDVTRTYRVTCSSASFQNGATLADSNLIARVIFNQPNVAGGASNETVHQSQMCASGGEKQRLNIDFCMSGGVSRNDGTSTITLQLASDDGNTWSHQDAASTNVFHWTVEDVGPLITSSGGTGAPSGSLTYTVRYVATASRSYDGSNVYIGSPDGDNNIYESTFADRSYVNERFQVIFPGANMRSDLAGATFIYARMWLYCFKAEETKGSIGFGVSTDTTLKATFSDTSIGQSWGADDDWPVPGWYYFDMLSTSGGHTLLSEFLDDGGNSILAKQPIIPGLAATAFRGFGYHIDYRPYIEVRYVGNAPSGTSGYGVGGYGVQGYGV